MDRIDTTRPPDLTDVTADLERHVGGDAQIVPRRWGTRQPRGRRDPDRTLLPAEVLDGGSVHRVWLDLPIAPPTPPPTDFAVAAVIAAHDEEDILDWVVRELVAQGLVIAVIDHDSADGTPAVLDALEREGLLAHRDHLDADANWLDVLDRKVEVATALGTDWAIHNDADEVRTGPWPGHDLRTAVWAAQQTGANVIDFTVVNHLPLADGPPVAHASELDHVDLGLRPGYFSQQKAWRTDVEVDLRGTSGHRVRRPGLSLFPLNFRCDHYPVRSQEHGHRKVAERSVRFAAEREARPGQHSHYDHVDADHVFGARRDELARCGDAWDTTNRARLLFRSGMEPVADYELV